MFDKKIILGSASPRRKTLVDQLGVECEVRKQKVDEHYPTDLDPYEVPIYLAELKAQPLRSTIQGGEVLLTSDTVVIHNNKVLAKPRDEKEAFTMLSGLSNDMNEVVTGVSLYSTNYEETFSVQTRVFFLPLKEEEIEYYIKRYKPFDKAGAYGIQEWIGQIGVKRIEGCFYNVMGLPVSQIWKRLNEAFARTDGIRP